jgi:hypothetical protein
MPSDLFGSIRTIPLVQAFLGIPFPAPEAMPSVPKANLLAMLAIYFTFYNFCRIHSSIRCTPAMEAGITKSV